MDRDQFTDLMAPAIDLIVDRGVDADLESALQHGLPPDGPWFADVEGACHGAIAAGWMCAEGRGRPEIRPHR